MALRYSAWYPLTPDAIDANAPAAGGVFEVRVYGPLLVYTKGRSAMVLYGAALSDANLHLYTDLPLVLTAGRNTGIKGGSHLRFPKRTPMTNLLVTMLDKAGVKGVESLGDSKGRLSLPA